MAIVLNRRRFERTKVDIPAYIGDIRWQRRDFVTGRIVDISLDGIKMSIPKRTRMEIQRFIETKELIIIFKIQTCLWPINVKINPLRISEYAEDVQFGASIIKPDFQAYSALQRYLN